MLKYLAVFSENTKYLFFVVAVVQKFFLFFYKFYIFSKQNIPLKKMLLIKKVLITAKLYNNNLTKQLFTLSSLSRLIKKSKKKTKENPPNTTLSECIYYLRLIIVWLWLFFCFCKIFLMIYRFSMNFKQLTCNSNQFK